MAGCGVSAHAELFFGLEIFFISRDETGKVTPERVAGPAGPIRGWESITDRNGISTSQLEWRRWRENIGRWAVAARHINMALSFALSFKA
jgi:hypothetical protein